MDIPQITSTSNAQKGDMGQAYLATGKQVALRRWDEAACDFGNPSIRTYETVGYVISGVMEIDIDGQTAKLKAGDSWLVPEGCSHRYRIIEAIIAIEATSPPARFGEQDQPVD